MQPSCFLLNYGAKILDMAVKTKGNIWVVVLGIFYSHPYLGKIPILTNIFQRGWNHQLDIWCKEYLLRKYFNELAGWCMMIVQSS